MTTKIGDIVHPSGKYIKDGEEKTSWTKCGALFRKQDGKYRIKMDAFPADCSDSGGWLAVFEPRNDNQDSQPQQQPQQQGFRKPAADFDDDVPF